MRLNSVIRNSIVTIETTDRGEKVYTSVKDNGMGIPRSALGKIWERFYKSDLSRGKDKKGTGLGLAIVKEAIQAHGGEYYRGEYGRSRNRILLFHFRRLLVNLSL